MQVSPGWPRLLDGYKATVVDIAPSLKKGGTPVDIKEGTVDIVRRMGLLDQIKSRALKPKRTQVLDMEGDNDVVATLKGGQCQRFALVFVATGTARLSGNYNSGQMPNKHISYSTTSGSRLSIGF